jgi:hypothetical protein
LNTTDQIPGNEVKIQTCQIDATKKHSPPTRNAHRACTLLSELNYLPSNMFIVLCRMIEFNSTYQRNTGTRVTRLRMKNSSDLARLERTQFSTVALSSLKRGKLNLLSLRGKVTLLHSRSREVCQLDHEVFPHQK